MRQLILNAFLTAKSLPFSCYFYLKMLPFARYAVQLYFFPLMSDLNKLSLLLQHMHIFLVFCNNGYFNTDPYHPHPPPPPHATSQKRTMSMPALSACHCMQAQPTLHSSLVVY
jgi:hypothetical protein